MIVRFFFLLLAVVASCVDAKPTEEYLKIHPIEEVCRERQKPHFVDNVPLLMQIAAKETDDTFFGYHGISQKSRLFQDVLHAVFEEVLRIEVPPDFQFLRAPGHEMWQWPNGKDSFLATFSNPVDACDEIAFGNLLALLEKKQEIRLVPSDFTSEEAAALKRYFQSYAAWKRQNDWAYQARKYSLPTSVAIPSSETREDRQQLIRLIEHKVAEKAPQADIKKMRDWFAHDYDDYQVFMLTDSQKQNSGQAQALDQLFHPFDDRKQPQQSMLVAVNVSLFANFKVSGCFTPKIFLKNQSASGGDNALKDVLKAFFTDVGIDPDAVERMWAEGMQIIEMAGDPSGCLLQLFDLSSQRGARPLELVDRNAFLCFRYGIPIEGVLPSKYVRGDYALSKGERDMEMRLVVDNQQVLNPKGPLRIVRHDPLPPEEASKIIERMRCVLRETRRDSNKIESYRALLLRCWNSDKNFYP